MEKKLAKKFIGKVTGNKMSKTVKVEISSREKHPVYKKIVSVRKVFLAHSLKKHEIGDTVEIVQSKPYSKKVKWRVI